MTEQELPTTDFEVRNLLTETIGNDVFEEMERRDPIHNVGNPQPRAVNPPTPVAPAQVPATTTEPKADPSQPSVAPAAQVGTPQPISQPEGRLILDKYKTEEEAKKAYHSLLHANKALMQQLDALKTPNAQSVETRVNPVVTSGKREALLKQFETSYGVSPEEFAPVVEAIAQDVIERVQRPRDLMEQADEYMLSEYPDSVRHKEELIQFMTTDDTVRPFVQDAWANQQYKAALEFGWLKYAKHLNQTELTVKSEKDMETERQMQLNAEVQKQQLEQARIDAGLISTQANGSREVFDNTPNRAHIERLTNIARHGDWAPLLRETIAKDLPDDVFGPGR